MKKRVLREKYYTMDEIVEKIKEVTGKKEEKKETKKTTTKKKEK